MSDNNKILNLPNLLTLLRIFLVPFYLYFLWIQPSDANYQIFRIIAFIIFSLAMITDKLDGDIARKRNIVTDFGKLMDPIADKLLICSAFIVLSLLDPGMWIFVGIIIFREIFITFFRFFYIKRYQIVLPAQILGKIKTAIQAMTVGFMTLPLLREDGSCEGAINMLILLLMFLSAAITLISGGVYIISAIHKKPQLENPKLKEAN